MKVFCSAKRGLGLSVASIALVGLAAHSASAESRSYVVSWLTNAAYSQDGDCPRIAPDQDEMARQQLRDNWGKSPKEIDDLMNGVNPDGTKDGNGYGGGHGTGKVHYMLIDRGRIDGKPVNVYQNPTSVADSHVPNVTGKYGYGFNLDGKGAASPNSFEDPDTHEKGINNQYFRAVGCVSLLRGTMQIRSNYWSYIWEDSKYTMPAWLITISGADLSKDGDATVTFERALESVQQDAKSETRQYTTFRIDPDPRWQHNVFPATIKGGVITTNQPFNFDLGADPFVMSEWKLHNGHVRFTLKPDGTLDGLLGGYTPWFSVYYMNGHKGESDEMTMGIDLPGMYYSLRKNADADPDPVTGQNMSISGAWHIEAVPAFVTHVSDNNKKTAQAGAAASRTP